MPSRCLGASSGPILLEVAREALDGLLGISGDISSEIIGACLIRLKLVRSTEHCFGRFNDQQDAL